MELKRVRTADVYPSEANPRRDFGDLDALAASFELNPRHPGEPMNPPLLVRDGEVYRIVDGERRCWAWNPRRSRRRRAERGCGGSGRRPRWSAPPPRR